MKRTRSSVALAVTWTRRAVAAALLQAALAPCAWAQPLDAVPRSVPMSGELGFESIRLPGGERVGLTGATLVFEVVRDFGIGPAVYGAATGQRGGFFVGGFEAQKRWGIGADFMLVTGLFAGGGGGGSAPVGGGLMLRPAVSLMARFGADFGAGISISDVRFPGGQIQSAQVGVVLAWGRNYGYFDAASAGAPVFTRETGFGLAEFSGRLAEYRLQDGSGRRFGLVGARAEWRDVSAHWHWGIEAGAAAHGDAAGYMELLGSLRWDWQPLDALPLRLGLQAAAGLGGGGGVPSGGGLLGKAGATVAWVFPGGWRAGFEAGRLEGLKRSPQAQSLEAWVALSFDDAAHGRSAPSAAINERDEWVASIRHVLHTDRGNGGHGAIDTIGGSFNHAIGGPFYLSLQAHSAFAGGAGAYSVGLMGLGIATPPGPWRVGAEALAGASGGGGISAHGGASFEGLSWAARSFGAANELRLGIGATRTLHSSSPIIEMSWSHAFGLSSASAR